MNNRPIWCKLISWATIFVFFFQPLLVSAEVIADKNAPGQHRPVIETTANGLPVVQITTPSGGYRGIFFNSSMSIPAD